MQVGILALQGDFREHAEILASLGVETKFVRLPADLQSVDRLIIPGGESTTIGKLMVKYGLVEPIRERAQQDMAVWGTCAGAIMLARTIAEGGIEGQPLLGLIDMVVRRNAFGRQIQSFETALSVPTLGERLFRGVFIRAPSIERVGEEVEVLAQLPEKEDIVAARHNRCMVATFHPELTSDNRFHRYFLCI